MMSKIIMKVTNVALFQQINTTLKDINLSGTSLSTNSLIAFSTVLQNNDTLEVLDISDNTRNTNSLTQSVQNDIIQHLATMIRFNEGLKELRMAKFGITDWAMVDFLAKGIQQNEHLVVLDLRA